MVKKIGINELKPGMYVCGLEKESGKALSFMNNIKVKNEEDVQRFNNNGYSTVYIDVEEEHARPPRPVKRVEKEPEVSPEASSVINPEEKIEEVEELPREAKEAPDSSDTVIEAELIPEGAGEAERGQEQPLDFEGLKPGVWKPLYNTVASDKGPEEAEEEKERSRTTFVNTNEYKDKEPQGETEIKDRVEFKEELKKAKKIRNEAVDLVKDFMQNIRMGKGIQAERVDSTVGKMVDSIFSNQDALASLSRLKSFDNYTFTHSVNVCTLSITLARHMGLSKDEIQELGVGAILHDVGKMLVPESILNKPGKLTDEEFDVMKSHTTLGAELLKKTKEISDEARVVALQHQEKYDGTGYPNRLAGPDIHIYGRIAAVADVYDAMTSKRVYKPGMPPEEALKKMYFLRGQHFEPELVERLIKCLGIYPIGTLVELNTGEMALVRMTNHMYPVQPLVLMLFNGEKKPCGKPFEVNLKNDRSRWIVASKNMENMEAIVDGLIA